MGTAKLVLRPMKTLLQRIGFAAGLAVLLAGCHTSPWSAPAQSAAEPARKSPAATPAPAAAAAGSAAATAKTAGAPTAAGPAASSGPMSAAGPSAAGGASVVDAQAVQQILAELQQAGQLDPAGRDRLLHDLQQTDPALWPLVVQQFRAALAYRQQCQQRHFADAQFTPAAAGPGGVGYGPAASYGPAATTPMPSGVLSAGTMAGAALSSDRPMPPEAAAGQALPLSPRGMAVSPAGLTPTQQFGLPANSGVAPPVSGGTSATLPAAAPGSPAPAVVPAPAVLRGPEPGRINPTTGAAGITDAAASLAQAAGRKHLRRPTNHLRRLKNPPAAKSSKRPTRANRRSPGGRICWLPCESARPNCTMRRTAATTRPCRPNCGYCTSWPGNATRPCGRSLRSRRRRRTSGPKSSTACRLRWMPRESSRRSAEAKQHLAEAVEKLGQTCPLVVRNLAFCNKIQSFGCVKQFEQYDFTPGQALLLYAEVENLGSETTPQG